MKASIKNIVLPDAPAPTRAAYKKPVEYINSKHLRVVEVPTVCNPRPAPPKKVKRFVEKKPAPRKERVTPEGFWTESRVDKLIEMYNAGLTYDEIGEYFGKTKSTICGKIRRLTDGGMVSNRRNNTPWTAKDLDTMKKMRNAGKTFDEIANKLGRSPQGCYEYYRKKVSLRCKT